MPQPGMLPPETQRQIRDLQNRVAAIERQLARTNPPYTPPIIFSYSGTLASNTESPPARFERGATIRSLAVTLGSAGSTDTILELKRSGTVIATITVPANTTAYNAPIGEIFGADQDTISLRCATAGTGAADLSAQARLV